jgi:hypothetical protein
MVIWLCAPGASFVTGTLSPSTLASARPAGCDHRLGAAHLLAQRQMAGARRTCSRSGRWREDVPA